MSSLFTSFISKKYFLLSLISLHTVKIYIYFFNVAIVVVVVVEVIVAEAAVGSVELQGERDLLSAV